MADFTGFTKEDKSITDKVRKLSDEIETTVDSIELEASDIVSCQNSDRSAAFEVWSNLEELVSDLDTS